MSITKDTKEKKEKKRKEKNAKAAFYACFRQPALYWVVPGLMLVVFAGQLYLATSQHLSPWKGGGFGMFASTDAPDMRVLYGEGYDAEGRKINIIAPFSGSGENGPFTSAMDVRLRTLPSREQLQQVARLLLKSVFVKADKDAQALYRHLGTANPHASRLTYYRPLLAYESVPAREQTRKLTSLTLTLLRIHYLEQDHALQLQPLLAPLTVHQPAGDEGAKRPVSRGHKVTKSSE